MIVSCLVQNSSLSRQIFALCSSYNFSVLILDRTSCNKNHVLTSPSGYISYSSAILDMLPSRDCPWQLSVSSTQTMKFSLIPLKKPNADCSNAVVFREQNVPRRIDLCAAPTDRPVYNTSHNAVTLYFEARPAPPFDYLLEYAGMQDCIR